MTPTVPRAESEPPAGVLVIDKAPGWTSHQVVAQVRRLMGTRKVGHAGTLDPMATGVLVIGVNRATRLLGHLMLTDKTYTATIRLGTATVTDDAEGDVTDRAGAAGLTDEQVAAGLGPLRGEILQVPSSVSAIKVNGVRSYAKVRAGEHVELRARPVTVRRLELLARRDLQVDRVACVDLDVVVECTSGTYIRALARDLGAALGCGGHLVALRRTAVGPFGLDEAHDVLGTAGPLPLIPMAEVAARNFATVVLTPEQAQAVGFGRKLSDLQLPTELAAMLSPGGDLLALYRCRGGEAVPEAVFVGG